uniref:translation initiation factor IF-2-like n=1 Tax=Callithrix jacchus TaxID=9483 RepID=UPI0023DD2B48|nr:translation initiation factor IF-2-like [Callithrix jacchus]
MDEMTIELGVRAVVYALRGTDRGGAGNYFLAFSRVLLPGNQQDPARSDSAEPWPPRWREGEWGGGGWQDRPGSGGGDLLRFLTVLHLCVDCAGLRVLEQLAAGGLEPRSGSPPATPWLRRALLAGTPSPSPPLECLEVGERTKASLCGDNRSATSTPSPVFVPSVARVSAGVPRGTPVLEASGPGSPQLCSVSWVQGRGHLPYTPARKSKSNADLHRGDSFVLQRRAITTADGGRKEMEKEGGGAGARRRRRRRRAPSCSLRSPRRREGEGRGRRRRRRRRSRLRALSPSSLRPSLSRTLACSQSGLCENPARGGSWVQEQGAPAPAPGEGVADAGLRPRTARGSWRRHSPDGARAHPCDRQSPGPPASVPARRSAGLSKSRADFPATGAQGARQRQSMSERANAGLRMPGGCSAGAGEGAGSQFEA